MSVETYWTGKVFVVDWTIAGGAGATVTGEVALPAGTTAAMDVEPAAAVFTARYTAVSAGRHAWKLTATGAAEGSEQGSFVVRRDLVGLPPITVDPTTDVGMVRLLAVDLDETVPLFEDAQIEAFLTMEGGVKKAAALALETIARSEVLISKKITTQDLSTDGPAVAKELRESAKALREQATNDRDDADGDLYGLDFVDFDPYAAYRTEL